MKIFSASFLGISSFLITIVNKRVLSIYKFPSFLVLCLGQMLAGIIILLTLRCLKVIKLERFSKNLVKSIMPIPLFYMGNMVFGLGGTQALNLPMFVASRRSVVLKTMILEFFLLGTRPAKNIQIVVFAMLFGAILAMSYDETFSLHGYLFVMAANTISALNGVYIKKKFSENKIDQYNLIFYSSLISFLPVFLVTIAMNQIEITTGFESWNDWIFCIEFAMSCVMGFVLMYSTNMCTNYNSENIF
jgi:solute carrier family 35 protein